MHISATEVRQGLLAPVLQPMHAPDLSRLLVGVEIRVTAHEGFQVLHREGRSRRKASPEDIFNERELSLGLVTKVNLAEVQQVEFASLNVLLAINVAGGEGNGALRRKLEKAARGPLHEDTIQICLEILAYRGRI